MSKKAYAAHHPVPISMAVRAGDFVYTRPRSLDLRSEGQWSSMRREHLDDGAGPQECAVREQVHLTFRFHLRRRCGRRLHA